MSATVPVTITLAVPSPETEPRPAVVPRVSVPLVAVSVTRSSPLSASGSAIDSPLAVAALITKAVFTGVTCTPGMWLAGPSLTAVMPIVAVSVPLRAGPPEWPRSFTVSVRVSPAGGVSVSIR